MLKERLTEPSRRALVIADCVKLVDAEVAAKAGLTGMAVKGMYGLVKAIKPGIIGEAVDHLLEDFAARLEPFYTAWTEQGGSLSDSFLSRRADVANALLGVTDAKVGNSRNATIKKAYEKLRPMGEKHVEAAVPGIARLIEAHAGEAAA